MTTVTEKINQCPDHTITTSRNKHNQYKIHTSCLVMTASKLAWRLLVDNYSLQYATLHRDDEDSKSLFFFEKKHEFLGAIRGTPKNSPRTPL